MRSAYQYFILVGIAIGSVLLLWWLMQKKDIPPVELSSDKAEETSPQGDAASPLRGKTAVTQSPQTQRPTNIQGQPMSDTELEAYGRKAIAEQAARTAQIEKEWKAQWDTPISFYGKVIDENEMPVAGASIEFERTDLQGEGLHSSTVTDALGLFSLTGVKGRDLGVSVSKQGYYTSKWQNVTSFLYADITGRGTFTPDHSNPVVFHLRKKGPGTDLITSDYGVKRNLQVTVPLDGTSVHVNLIQRKTGLSGEMTVSQTKPPYENWKQATEWSFRMEIPGGGFVEHHDEFPFEAPEAGYKPTLEFNFHAGETNWATDLKKDYYIRFGNPPRYGRLHLETSITMSGARLTYAINPDGTRYLEPK